MANNDVQHLLDMLYEMIDGAKNAPLTSDKCILNRDEALDLLDEIRAQMPVELKRAQELVRARDEYVEAAKRDVERLVAVEHALVVRQRRVLRLVDHLIQHIQQLLYILFSHRYPLSFPLIRAAAAAGKYFSSG